MSEVVNELYKNAPAYSTISRKLKPSGDNML